MIVVKLFVLGYIGLFYFAQAERCFHCTDVADPSNCTKIETCGPDQTCSIRQFVTAVGDVMYSSGCLDKTKCGTLGNIFGRRNLSERGTDVTTCHECCDQDFCNSQGCGTTAISRDKRGPYCFTCDASLDPQACTDINICKDTEECIVVVSAHLTSSSQFVYTSMCESKAACAAFSHIGTNGSCPPVCCNQDFCNDNCRPGVPATSPPASCKVNHFYDDLTGMCIKIDETRKLNYADAMKACEAIGDQLVTIDTHEKTLFVEYMILRHSQLSDESEKNYYIGAFDKHDNSVFYWPNGHKMYYTNWGGGDEVVHNQQPDGRIGNPQNCVILYGLDHYRWHDDKCSHLLHFICEDRSTLNVNIVHQTGASDSANIPLPTDGSNTFHCNAHGGYMHLHAVGTDLCVHIVTHHADWNSARAACKKEGGDLVVLDTTSKATLMRGKVGHSYSSQNGYWIGAKDFSSHNHFLWVNGQPVTHGDWYPGQPNHHDGGHDHDCACMCNSGEHYHWHDDYCPKRLGYICERK